MTDKLKGLTSAQVEQSRARHGSNILTPPERRSAWSMFLEKFRDPLIVILMVAGVMSVLISCYEYWGLHQEATVFFEPVGIFIAIFLATGLAFIFEHKAEKEFALLNTVSDDQLVKVMRDGNVTSIPRGEVVVGDVVLLATGDEVPADGELLSSTDLSVDESTLTGEPLCRKSEKPEEADPDATYPTSRLLRGTKVMEGHAVMRVDAVGDHTEHGRVFIQSQIDNSVRTPLNEQLDRLARMVSLFSYVVGALIIVGRCISWFVFGAGRDGFEFLPFLAYFLQSCMIAVTLIVVSVPEGLPMAVTISLAYSMRRMLQTNNLVRRLHACETMGAATVICTDKTGTLTRNQMRVAQTCFYGVPNALPADAAERRAVEWSLGVNSTAMLDRSHHDPVVVGNPTEGALILWLHDKGVDYAALRSDAKVVAELPFSTENKYMATVVEAPQGGYMLLVKGAPEIVANLCRTSDKAASDKNDSDKSDSDKQITDLVAQWQSEAMRTLGFAAASAQNVDELLSQGRVIAHNLKMIGAVGIADPVRDEVPEAVREVTDAGIEVKIVTGDTPSTATQIGREIGLTGLDRPGAVVTGTEFAEIPDAELPERVGSLRIIARARPMDKKRLVEALQARGDVVAVTGDGTNDAPALKASHVGLSMGDGTAVAKEASDITIIDNSFASIGRAVVWGRSLYKNIQRFILFQLTVNVVACLVVLAGACIGTESPLTVTQMLWVNLIMDTFAAMALAALPPSQSVMRDKPRDRNKFIITPAMWRFIGIVGSLMFAFLLALLWFLENYDVTALNVVPHATPGVQTSLTPYELSIFFTTFVFLQFWNIFNAKAFGSRASALRLRGCGPFLLIVAVIFFGQILIVNFGREFFSVAPLSLQDWCVIILGTSPVAILGELIRLLEK